MLIHPAFLNVRCGNIMTRLKIPEVFQSLHFGLNRSGAAFGDCTHDGLHLGASNECDQDSRRGDPSTNQQRNMKASEKL